MLTAVSTPALQAWLSDTTLQVSICKKLAPDTLCALVDCDSAFDECKRRVKPHSFQQSGASQQSAIVPIAGAHLGCARPWTAERVLDNTSCPMTPCSAASTRAICLIHSACFYNFRVVSGLHDVRARQSAPNDLNASWLAKLVNTCTHLPRMACVR